MENKNQEMNLDYEILMQAYTYKCKESVKFQTLATRLSIELEEYKKKEMESKMEKDLKQEEEEGTENE